ncbi:hypothetical protein Tco_1402071 [Tanacetum coccineum]
MVNMGLMNVNVAGVNPVVYGKVTTVSIRDVSAASIKREAYDKVFNHLHAPLDGKFKGNFKLRGRLFHSWKIRFEDVHVLKVKIASMDHLGINDAEDVGAEADMNNLNTFMLKNPKSNPYIKGSKLDRGYARRASTIQATRSLDPGGFSKWQKAHRNLRSVLGQQANGACSPNFWSISAKKIAYLDRGSLKLQFSNWILPYRFRMRKLWSFYYVIKVEDLERYEEELAQIYFVKLFLSSIPQTTFKIDDIIFGSIKKSLCTEFEKMMHKKFQMNSMGELTFFLGLQCKKQTVVANSITEAEYVAASSCCGQVLWIQNLLLDYGYLKGQPKLGLWYPKDSPFDLVAYIDSDYAGASLDRKSTTGGCQFLGCRLISWQCKKQTVVANSTTEAEYVAASSCYGQVL